MAKKTGRPSTQQLDEQRGDIVWQRLAEQAREATLDPRMTSQIMRWRVKKLLTDSQAAAADKIGQIYGRFERLHGVKRSTRSPSYEYSTAGEQEPRVKIDGNWYYPGDREYDDWARGIDEEWGDLQKLMPARDRDVRDAIEALCVENRAISSFQLRLCYPALNEVSEQWGLGPTAAADESTPLAPTRSKPRASRQERFEEGLYATLKIGRLSGDHAPAPMTEAEAAEISARALAQDAAVT